MWLDDENSEIIDSTDWDFTQATGLTKDSDVVSADGKVATAWISGGTAGETYEVSCEITTNNSPARTDERTIKIKVKER